MVWMHGPHQPPIGRFNGGTVRPPTDTEDGARVALAHPRQGWTIPSPQSIHRPANSLKGATDAEGASPGPCEQAKRDYAQDEKVHAVLAIAGVTIRPRSWIRSRSS